MKRKFLIISLAMGSFAFSQQEISEVVDDLHSLGYDNVSIANVVLSLKNK